MFLLIIRSILLYFLTLIAVKVMGKRQIGQLQPFDFVVILIISEMASLAMQSNTTPLINSLIPIVVITLLQILISLLALKSERMRYFVCGSPTILVKDGKIQEKELAKLRINLNDLQEQCRVQGYFDLSGLSEVIMETNGGFSIRPKTINRPLQMGDITQIPPQEIPGRLFILDGKINEHSLKELGLDQIWLKKKLQETHAGQLAELFIAGIDEKGQFFFQKKIQREKN